MYGSSSIAIFSTMAIQKCSKFLPSTHAVYTQRQRKTRFVFVRIQVRSLYGNALAKKQGIPFEFLPGSGTRCNRLYSGYGARARAWENQKALDRRGIYKKRWLLVRNIVTNGVPYGSPRAELLSAIAISQTCEIVSCMHGFKDHAHSEVEASLGAQLWDCLGWPGPSHKRELETVQLVASQGSTRA